MIKKPGNWERHYHGEPLQLQLKRKYSFSDRCRYYFAQPQMKSAIQQLFDNFAGIRIPLNMLSQYMPLQYRKVRDGILENSPRELVKDFVVQVAEDYNFATKLNYMIPS